MGVSSIEDALNGHVHSCSPKKHMKPAKFQYKQREFWGLVENDSVRILKAPPYRKIEVSGRSLPLDKVRLRPPAEPSKIILAGLNYKDHAKEMGMKIPREPVIFLKAPSSLIAAEERIVFPPEVTRLDYEAELALVIKKKAKAVKEKEAQHYILGFTCLNDVTARGLQKKDAQWTRAKSFDTFCPLGPWLETKLDPRALKIRSYLNGALKQHSSTANFIFPVHYLVSFVSRVMTLLPGDVISTGTPAGVGRMKEYDIIEVEIEGIGRLRNSVGAR